jgi:1,4-alpha-glucan branching enzyme
VDNPVLKYQWLAAWDRDLVALLKDRNVLQSAPAQLLHVDHENKILIAERANLIFVINLSPDKSHFGYPINPYRKETHQLLLDSDEAKYGGHARIDHAFDYPIDADGRMKIYTTSRTSLVFG